MQSDNLRNTEFDNNIFPSKSGLMPGFSFTTVLRFALVVRPSSGLTVVIFSRIPYRSINAFGLPHVFPSSIMSCGWVLKSR